MAINDILPPVDAVPGVADSARPNSGVPTGAASNADSEYRRALSETLNRTERRDSSQGESTRATDRREQPREAENRRQSEEAGNNPVRETPETERNSNPNGGETEGAETETSTPAEAGQPDTNNEASSTGEAAAPEQEAPSEEPLNVELLLAAEGALLPPDLSLLFAQQQQAGTDGGDAGVQVDAKQGAAPIRPPDGLFESLNDDGRPAGPQVSLPADQILSANGTPAETASVENTSAPAETEVTLNAQQQADAVRLDGGPATKFPDEGNQQQILVETRSTESIIVRTAETTNVATTSSAAVDNSPSAAEAAAANAVQQQAAIAAAESNNPGTTIQQSAPSADASQPTSTTESDESTESSGGTAQQHESTSRATVTTTSERSGTANNSTQTDSAGADTFGPSTTGSETSNTAASASGGQSATTPVTPHQAPIVESSQGPLALDAEQFVDRLASEVQAAPQNGQQLRVRLYPPHLGSLQIEVTSHQGTLTVQMEVQSAAAQHSLLDNMSYLRDALTQQGSNVDRIEVQLVETHADEGRPNLTDDQQQQQESEQQPEDDQPEQENEGETSEQEAEPGTETVAAVRQMDELDIQV